MGVNPRYDLVLFSKERNDKLYVRKSVLELRIETKELCIAMELFIITKDLCIGKPLLWLIGV